jgi:hypothetical protein
MTPDPRTAMLAEFAALFPGPVEAGARVRLVSPGPLVFYGRVNWVDLAVERTEVAWNDGMTTTVSTRSLAGVRIYEGM